MCLFFLFFFFLSVKNYVGDNRLVQVINTSFLSNGV